MGMWANSPWAAGRVALASLVRIILVVLTMPTRRKRRAAGAHTLPAAADILAVVCESWAHTAFLEEKDVENQHQNCVKMACS